MRSRRPFRFGVYAFRAMSREEWVSKAQHVEELGYNTLFVADHLHTFPPLAGMLAAADATSTLRVGSLVLANDFWNPVWLAREVAAIDLLSNGRLEFGLGTGYAPTDYAQGGITFDPPQIRVSRFEEAVKVFKGFFSAAPFTFTGRYYTIRDLIGGPPWVQQPHPPLLIGGGGKRMLTLAAQEADIIGISGKTTPSGGFDPGSMTPEAVAQKVGWVQQAAGARFDTLELNTLVATVAVIDDRVQTAEQLADGWTKAGYPVQPEWLLTTPAALIGSIDQIVAELEERRERYHISYIVIFEHNMDAFAPVIARLSGR